MSAAPANMLSVDSDDAGLMALMTWIKDWVEANDVPSEPAYKLRLVLEEIAANAVSYGYPHGSCGTLECSLEVTEAGAYRMTIVDDAIAFNPLDEAAEPDLDADLDDREIGGLGVFLVKNVTASVTYERRDGRNILDMVI